MNPRAAPFPDIIRFRVLVLMGTRPEVVKLFPVVRALRAEPGLDVRTVTSGQHDGLLDQALAMAGLVPDIRLPPIAAAGDLDRLNAALRERLKALLARARPDVVLVQGDTATALAGAQTAHEAGIPVGHVEAGLRSGDLSDPWPEESYRRRITGLARWHFAPTVAAEQALLDEGIARSAILRTGNTGIDALHVLLASAPAPPPALAGLLDEAQRRPLILVTCHRRENFGRRLDDVVQALGALAGHGGALVAWPVHPNPAVARALAPLSGKQDVRLLPPLDYPAFLHLLAAAHFVLSDSGGIQEEAPALGKPLLVLRETTERPEGVAAGVARLVGTDPARIIVEGARLLDDAAHHAAMARPLDLYGDGRAAGRIAAFLAALAPAAIPIAS